MQHRLGSQKPLQVLYKTINQTIFVTGIEPLIRPFGISLNGLKLRLDGVRGSHGNTAPPGLASIHETYQTKEK